MTKDVSQKRPPVIVVLGHVDHGKTTLLDYIRKTNSAAKEAGGITQSIGAYEITHQSRNNAEINAEKRGKIQRESAFSQRSSAEGDFSAGGRKITFIDTPGHEAFSKMRTRGARVADLAILVVAVDDGVQPQTKESIRILKETKIPFVLAINKIDKQGIDINKVKNELTAEGVLLEGYGGNVSHQAISGKTGEGVPELLDLLLLAADLEDLKFNPHASARGVILESKLDSRRGILATAIIKDGTLKVGEYITAGSASGKIKSLDNFLGKRIKEAMPASPVLISGFEALPQVGEEFVVSEKATPTITNDKRMTRIKDISEIRAPISDDSRIINLILKADVSGSLEALSQIIENLPRPESVALKVLIQSVGEITDGDVKSAIPADAIIIGFKVEPNKAAQNLAEAQRVTIITSEIVYELVKALEEEFKNLGREVVRGELEVLAVFDHRQGGASKKGVNQQIVGGKVLKGEMLNNSVLEIVRRGAVLGKGKVLNLQQNKKDTPRAEAGSECGLLVDADVMIKEGDHLILR